MKKTKFNKIKLLTLFLAFMTLFILSSPIDTNVVAETYTPEEHKNNNWQWQIETDNIIGYEVEMSYEFESGTINTRLLEIWNITEIANTTRSDHFSETNEWSEVIAELLYHNVSSGSGELMNYFDADERPVNMTLASFNYNETVSEHRPEGNEATLTWVNDTLLFDDGQNSLVHPVPLVVPVNDSVDFTTAALAYVLNKTYSMYSQYNGLFNSFDESDISIDDNFIGFKNSTHDYYINMTYYDNGTLRKADGRIRSGQDPMNISFSYTHVTDYDILQDTLWGVEEGDELFLGMNEVDPFALTIVEDIEVAKVWANNLTVIGVYPDNSTWENKSIRFWDEHDHEHRYKIDEIREDWAGNESDMGNFTIIISEEDLGGGDLSDHLEGGKQLEIAEFSQYREIKVEIIDISKEMMPIPYGDIELLQGFDVVYANVSAWDWDEETYVEMGTVPLGIANDLVPLNIFDELFGGEEGGSGLFFFPTGLENADLEFIFNNETAHLFECDEIEYESEGKLTLRNITDHSEVRVYYDMTSGLPNYIQEINDTTIGELNSCFFRKNETILNPDAMTDLEMKSYRDDEVQVFVNLTNTHDTDNVALYTSLLDFNPTFGDFKREVDGMPIYFDIYTNNSDYVTDFNVTVKYDTTLLENANIQPEELTIFGFDNQNNIWREDKSGEWEVIIDEENNTLTVCNVPLKTPDGKPLNYFAIGYTGIPWRFKLNIGDRIYLEDEGTIEYMDNAETYDWQVKDVQVFEVINKTWEIIDNQEYQNLTLEEVYYNASTDNFEGTSNYFTLNIGYNETEEPENRMIVKTESIFYPPILPLHYDTLNMTLIADILEATDPYSSIWDVITGYNNNNSLVFSNSTGEYMNVFYHENGVIKNGSFEFGFYNGDTESTWEMNFNVTAVSEYDTTNEIAWNVEEGDVYYFGNREGQYRYTITNINQTTINQKEYGLKPYNSWLTFEVVWAKLEDYDISSDSFEIIEEEIQIGFASNYYYFVPGNGNQSILVLPKVIETGNAATGFELWEQLEPLAPMMDIKDEPTDLGDNFLILEDIDGNFNITLMWDENGVMNLSATPHPEGTGTLNTLYRLNDTGYLESGNQQLELTGLVDMNTIQYSIDIEATDADMSRLLYALLNSSYNPTNTAIDSEFEVLAYLHLMITNYSKTANLNITLDLSNSDINLEEFDVNAWMWENEWMPAPVGEGPEIIVDVDQSLVTIVSQEDSSEGFAGIIAFTLSEKFTLNVTDPVNETYYGETAPDFAVTIEGAGIEDSWYTINEDGTKHFFDADPGTGTIDLTAWNNLDNEAEINITFYANNTFRVQKTQTITIYKDTEAPRITIFSPSENDYFGDTPPDFEVEFDDLFLNETWYTINGGETKYFFTENETIDEDAWDGIDSSAEVALTFYANDSTGKINSETVIVNKNTEAPIITIHTPESYSYFGDTPPEFEVEIQHDNYDQSWYTINENETKHFFTENGTIEETAWNNLEDEAEVTITFYANTSSTGLTGEASVTIYKDISAPVIAIISPEAGQLFPSAPDYTVMITDEFLDTTNMWYTLNETDPVGFTKNGTISSGRWSEVGEGDVNITFYAQDSYGNIGSESVIVHYDLYAPSINIISPEEGELFDATSPEFEIDIEIDPGTELNKSWYKINDGETKYFFTENETIDETAWNDLDDETEVTLTFYANNTDGTIGYSEVTVERDAAAPSITIHTPEGGQTFENAPDFAVTIIDPNLYGMWYTINDGSTQYTFTENGTIDANAWNDLPLITSVEITFYAEDTAGNTGSESVTVIREVIEEEEQEDEPEEDEEVAIPGPNILIIGGISAICITFVAIHISKRRKFN